MADAYIVRPTDNLPDALNHPLIEIKKVTPVKCPLCDYTLKIHYIALPDEDSERKDVTHYELSLKNEHGKSYGHPG